MPYCPKCGTEFRVDFEVCSDCNVDLVAEPPVQIPEEYSDAEWIELYTFPGTLYARMAIELLNREGIPAYSQSDLTSATFGVSSGGSYFGSNSTVFVLEPDYDRGRDCIETMIDELPGADDDYAGEEDDSSRY